MRQLLNYYFEKNQHPNLIKIKRTEGWGESLLSKFYEILNIVTHLKEYEAKNINKANEKNGRRNRWSPFPCDVH